MILAYRIGTPYVPFSENGTPQSPNFELLLIPGPDPRVFRAGSARYQSSGQKFDFTPSENHFQFVLKFLWARIIHFSCIFSKNINLKNCFREEISMFVATWRAGPNPIFSPARTVATLSLKPNSSAKHFSSSGPEVVKSVRPGCWEPCFRLQFLF